MITSKEFNVIAALIKIEDMIKSNHEMWMHGARQDFCFDQQLLIDINIKLEIIREKMLATITINNEGKDED